MGGIEEDYKKGRGGLQGGVNVLQGGVIGGALIWLGVSGTVSGNGENRGRDIHQVSEKNHGKVGADEGRWE